MEGTGKSSVTVIIVLHICNIGFYLGGAACDGGFAAILLTISCSSVALFCQFGDIVDVTDVSNS